MKALLNLEVTNSSLPNKNNARKSYMLNGIWNLCISKNLSFLTCQILSFKSEKISLRKKFSDKSLRKIFIGKRAQWERNACSKEK